jgi:hypothetical protein
MSSQASNEQPGHMNTKEPRNGVMEKGEAYNEQPSPKCSASLLDSLRE